MAPKLILLIGFQGSTKSTFAKGIVESVPDIVILSKDTGNYKSTEHMVEVAEKHLLEGKTVMIDNTNLTIAARKPFIELGKRLGIKVDGRYFKSSIEDCQIRHLKRMYELFGYIPQTGKLKDGSKHSHAFGPGALFAARKAFEEPKKEEGFYAIIIQEIGPITWDPVTYHKKALFLDIDGTIRETEHLPHKYPTQVEEVQLLHSKEKMREKLDAYRAEGYMLIGVSNQSGVSKGTVTEEKVDEIFEKTRSELGYTKAEFPILYCPHSSMPGACFCRKPQSGMVMECIMKLGLDPAQCIMVGDRKTDETMAKRLQLKYYDVKNFW